MSVGNPSHNQKVNKVIHITLVTANGFQRLCSQSQNNENNKIKS